MQGYTTKLYRALHHLNELEGEISIWFRGDHYRVIHERHPDGPGNYQVRIEIGDVPQERFAALIGDFLQNLRACLDHLAFALADTYTTATGAPKGFEQGSEFPIFGDEDRKGTKGVGATKFADSRAKKIGSVDPKAQTLIEGLQPYHRGDEFRSHPLWQLHELCIIDKHRLLLTVAYGFEAVAMPVDEMRNIELHGQFEVFEGPVENNAIVARYGASPADPKQAMNVDLNPVLDIAFAGGTPIVSGEKVMSVLGDIHNFVVTEVTDPLSKFLT